jgi:enoyl-CoA hydratase/carnithine racemase
MERIWPQVKARQTFAASVLAVQAATGQADGPPKERAISNELVISVIDGPVARLTLNDPDRANVLSRAMMASLAEALNAASDNPEVRVIVLAAAGRIFCAGHDLAELRASDDAAEHRALFDQCSALMLTIGEARPPVIARIHGAAVAAGCQLAASCDMAFAADTVRFAVSGVNLGLFCSTPGVALARNIGRKAAAEMLFTGQFIGAAEAERLGLINRAVPAGELNKTVDAAAASIAGKAPDAVALGKQILRRQVEAPLADAYALAGGAMVENLSFASAKTGIDGFLKK